MPYRNKHHLVMNDTIAAISTPRGEGAIGIVRISGPEAIIIADKIFIGKNGITPSKLKSHTVSYGHIHSNGKVIDEVLVTVMKGPLTYTKEDSVEISGHGGDYSLRKILEAALNSGARIAEPGEFTKRAYINGRLDLSQAESVTDIINAETESGLNLAVNHLKGALSKEIKRIKTYILDFYAPLEAAVDFPDEEIPGLKRNELGKRILKAEKEIVELLKTRDSGRKIRKGISVAITGRPNVGKSSLFNLLLEENRSIVTHIPGTTRDVLEENLVIKGVLFRISDTAGLRTPRGVVEKIGVGLTQKKISEADIVLYMIDNKGLSAEDNDFLKKSTKSKIIVVINKIDLSSKIKSSMNIFKKFETVRVSVKKDIGMKDLSNSILKLAKRLAPGKDSGKMKYLINERQYEALVKAKNSMRNAHLALSAKFSYEFIAEDVRQALNLIGEITGENITEETLDEIFSKFCIGK